VGADALGLDLSAVELFSALDASLRARNRLALIR